MRHNEMPDTDKSQRSWEDYDLEACVKHNINSFSLNDISHIIGCIEGENDGAAWHWIVLLKDNTFAYITGGCDYTGWDCQSGGSISFGKNIKEVLSSTPTTDNYNRQVTEILTDRCYKYIFNNKLEDLIK